MNWFMAQPIKNWSVNDAIQDKFFVCNPRTLKTAETVLIILSIPYIGFKYYRNSRSKSKNVKPQQ